MGDEYTELEWTPLSRPAVLRYTTLILRGPEYRRRGAARGQLSAEWGLFGRARGCGQAVATAHLFRRFSAEEGRRGVDNVALAERLTPDEDAKLHAVTVGERELCQDLAPNEINVDEHDRSLLRVSGGTAHRAAVVDRKLNRHRVLIAELPGMRGEPNPRRAVAFELRNLGGVQR